MSFSSRYITLIVANMLLWAAMLAWLNKTGIDITGSTLADNASNIGFAFDFLFFIVASFSLNITILTWPSKNQNTLNRLFKLIEEKQQHVKHSANIKRNRRRPA